MISQARGSGAQFRDTSRGAHPCGRRLSGTTPSIWYMCRMFHILLELECGRHVTNDCMYVAILYINIRRSTDTYVYIGIETEREAPRAA